jgi:transcriptional regulator of acetoin/glycerol metabolism
VQPRLQRHRSGSTFFADAKQLAGLCSRVRKRHRDGTTDEILPEDLPNALLEEQSSGLAAHYHDTLNQTKKQLVLTALDEANGTPVEEARLLGIHPKYLHRLIRYLNLKSAMKRLG